MKILIIGSGGREHAMAWQIAKDASVTKIYVAPGNAGTQFENKTQNVDIDILDFEQLSHLVIEESIDLTIVGPEAPLVLGIVDFFQQKGLAIFGPNKAAAQLEGSKIFAKQFLDRHHIPTASYQSFNDADLAKEYVIKQSMPIVIKVDGLAEGKGVIIADTQQQALQGIDHLFSHYGKNDMVSVVIEEFLEGEEASFIVMLDSGTILPMATSQDHKARDDGDKGPNTGGMGAYSPAPIVTSEIFDRIMQTVINPVVNGLKVDGYQYTGFLYAGLMIDKQGQCKVLEFNCRLGDPETQVIMMRLQTSLAKLCLSATKNNLQSMTASWDSRFALGVIMAAGGYPQNYKKGDVIYGVNQINSHHCQVFHSGTIYDQDHLLTNGGRILCLVSLDGTLSGAQRLTYQSIQAIQFSNAFYRNDIGFKALKGSKDRIS